MDAAGIRASIQVGDLIKLTWRSIDKRGRYRLICKTIGVGDGLWVSSGKGRADRHFDWELLESGEIQVTRIARNVDEFRGWIDREGHIRDLGGNIIGKWNT